MLGRGVAVRQRLSVSGRALARCFGTSPAELDMEARLRTELQATKVDVTDVSGGCGEFYQVKVSSPLFQNKTPLQRNRLVHQVLKQELERVHGMNIECKVD